MSRQIRYQSVISRQADEPIGEDHWLNQFQKNLQKGAVQPRTQESLFDQINSIMNGNSKSKFPSVEAAVQDMKERSGLTAYLKKSEDQFNIKTANAEKSKEDIQFESDVKTAAASNDWYQVGYLIGKFDNLHNQIVDGVESIRTIKYFNNPEISSIKPPMNKWLDYTMGYSSGAQKSEEAFKKDMRFTMDVINNINMKKKASDNNSIDKKIDMLPIVIKKHPPVLKTLENYIRDTKGNLPVPAIIEKIRSIHRSDCSDAKDWDDDKLIRMVSKLNLGAKKNNPDSYDSYNNLGTRDSSSDSEVDPSNTDAFFALTPVKM